MRDVIKNLLKPDYELVSYIEIEDAIHSISVLNLVTGQIKRLHPQTEPIDKYFNATRREQ